MKLHILQRGDFDRKARKTLAELEQNYLSFGGKLDDFLDGGVPEGKICHIYGPPGSGKTNLCILGAVNAARAGKKVVYIDTEGGFSVDRLMQVCPDEKILERIYLHQPTSFDGLKAVISKLGKFVDSGFGVIVVDSMVSLYRLELKGDREQILDLARELGRQVAALSKLAREKKLAVLVCNQVYSSFGEDEIVPVGGDVLMYWSKTSVELEKCGSPGNRKAIIRKHPHTPEGKTVQFRLTGRGIE